MAVTDTAASVQAPKPAAVQPPPMVSSTVGTVRSNVGAAPTASIHKIEDRASGEGILDATQKVVQQDETARFRATVEQDLNQRVLHDPSAVSLAGNGGTSQPERKAQQDTFQKAGAKWDAENRTFDAAAKAQLGSVTSDAKPGEVERATENKDKVLASMKRAAVEQPHVAETTQTGKILEKANRSTGDDVLAEGKPATVPPAPAAVVPATGHGEAPIVVNAPSKSETPAPQASAAPAASGTIAAPAQAPATLSVAEARVDAAGATGSFVASAPNAKSVPDASFNDVAVPGRKPVNVAVADARPVMSAASAVSAQPVADKIPAALGRLQKAGVVSKDATFESVPASPVAESTSTVLAAQQTAAAQRPQATVLGITQQTGIVIPSMEKARNADPVPVGASPQRRNNPAAKSVPTMSVGGR